MPNTNRLPSLREAQGLTPKQLAQQLNVHPITVTRWERGDTGIPEKYWSLLSAIFGVSVAYLLGLENGNGKAAA